MKKMEIRAIRGPNYYSSKPVIFIQLDIEDLELLPTDLVFGFKENIEKMMPSLYEHKCSIGTPGGFFERVISGTWAAHVVEHVAIELQRLAGHNVAFGKTFTMKEKGIYNLVYHYQHEKAALRAGEMAIEIVQGLFKGQITDVEPLIKELKRITESSRLGPSTQAIVSEAQSRGIPHLRLNEDSYVQLGQGKYLRRLQATIVDDTSALGVEIADDKERTKEILSSIGVPVPAGRAVNSLEEAVQVTKEVGYPVVVKPLVGNHGRGITVNVTNIEELAIAYQIASEIYQTVLVEQFIKGFDFRVLVIDGKFVAAALREPAYVIGNGNNTIEELIDEENKQPDRGTGHEKNLTKISVDYSTKRVLELQELKLETILPAGKKIYIKSTANLSTGATALDVTDSVHPLNRLMAERMARNIGLNIMGIDIVAQTLETPLEHGLSGVVEVNAAPGFRMHLHPTKGEPRNIAGHVVDMLFPPGQNHSIPICAVTGTNGKTTTTTLISHILGVNGYTVGMTSTDAVTIHNVPILTGDYSGPEGAQTVIMDATVDHAVLEVARGGILRRGLGFKECDVGILLNISSDHLGEGGIDSLEKLARLKSTVTEAVKPSGFAVFNGDDALVLSCVVKTKAHPVLFSKDFQNPALKENLERGGFNVTIKEGMLIISKKNSDLAVVRISQIPITFGGKADFNIENAMAAVAACHALGLGETEIRQGLVSFRPSMDQLPGRMNIIDMGEFKAIVDYSHNVEAVISSGEFIKSSMSGRKIRMASGVGSRRNVDIENFGAALSKFYDYFVLCDCDPRDRPEGETVNILKQGLMAGGIEAGRILVARHEIEATKIALEMAEPGDVVMLQADNIDQVLMDVLEYQSKLRMQTS